MLDVDAAHHQLAAEVDQLLAAAGDADGGSWAVQTSARQMVAVCVASAMTSLELAASLVGTATDRTVFQGDAAQIVVAAERVRSLLDAVQAHALAQVDSAAIADETAGLSTSRWYAATADIPVGLASHRLGVANKLRTLPELESALRSGRVNAEHARVLCKAINDRNRSAMADALGHLIDAAEVMAFDHWRRQVEMLARLADANGPHDPAADTPASRITLSPSDGFVLIRGELAGESAMSVADTLNAVADELFHAYARDHQHCADIKIPSRAELMAEALQEICRRATVATSDAGPARPEATITVHGNLDQSSTDPTGERADARFTVWGLHHDLLGPLTASQIPTWLCDTDLVVALVDQLGVPLDMGRRTREPTVAQKRALRLRDGCCAAPGCDARITWLDAHHIDPWAGTDPDCRGGPTDLDNLVLVCRRHHNLVHRRGWRVELHRSGFTIWTTPTGARFWGQRHHSRPSSRPPPPPD